MFRSLLAAGLLAAAAAAQPFSSHAALYHDTAAGGSACDPCAPTSGRAVDAGPPISGTAYVQVHLDTCLNLSRWGVLFLGLPSPTPLPLAGVCGDVLLSPAAIFVHQQPWNPPPFSNFYSFQFDVYGAPRHAMIWLQMLAVDADTGALVSVSDRFRLLRL